MSKICLITIENYKNNNKVSICFNEEDFYEFETNWNKQDKLLKDLNKKGHFNNHSSWNELIIDEWCFLVKENLKLYLDLPYNSHADIKNKTVKSFHFLLLGMITFVEKTTNQNIEYVKIQILQNDEIITNISSNLDINTVPKNSKPSLEVVVDNN